ncbi:MULTISPECIES: 3-ketoacyl-ACP reductase [unclassified Rhizobium]|uniref:3-ketoacyl-ACP reductase n=1 Tax=unclassified Rhizobium TaxID=2613769 RepID=UPI00161E3E11|nr:MULTISPECIES: 3-ketoacyl-ACP reductase [unclassified Rhizobium]MBB3544940.1 NAD(P)-dependent dehydrogenase (short-subunit alcohol dehydrogenase family) [Rhizobium sp. BK399]MCS3744239.1 NAD(P)-dependent dehydrogenase (short-subunit alcohol dehydrogenase family) [Rhizobium sp. BK661]MCS4095671.1 NAD(P)-dependent dehydrogenase (short-subunit alcohol dehydrogenase family) [Rhizobium sp. BK176]
MSSGAKQAALITGSSRGIGLAIAQALAHRGFNIALNGFSDSEELDLAVASLRKKGVIAIKVPADVSVLAKHEIMLDAAEAACGPLTTLVNNAGVSVLQRGDLLDVSEESYDRCMAVNTKAHFFLTQAFARRLVARERSPDLYYSVVNVTSSNAVAASVLRGEYCASKAAAAMISKVFAARLAKDNIAVFDVQPGLIETDMTAAVKDTYKRRAEEGLTLFPRIGQPDEMGRIVQTLATGGLPYMTGQTLSADGGLLVPRF